MEIAIIDPLREISTYFERADKVNGKIIYICEILFHFVSGHESLGADTVAIINCIRIVQVHHLMLKLHHLYSIFL